MFAKFDENGRILSYSEEKKIEDIRPDPTGFEPVSDFPIEDRMFLRKENGAIFLDEEEKEKLQEKAAAAETYRQNKDLLKKLTEDIVQFTAGEEVPGIEERKAEFIRIHNAVRIYEGKDQRTTR